MTGADEVFALARDFGTASSKVASSLFDVYRVVGEGFRDEWQLNARATVQDGHAAKYPDSISTEMKLAGLGIEVETGPEAGPVNQGFLGRILEFGGEHSPAYLSGLAAMSVAERDLHKRADAAIGYVLP